MSDIRSFVAACDAGAASAGAAVDACLSRIAAHDGALAAMLRVLPDAGDTAQARDRAAGADGPLHGVPIVLKDNIDLHGTPTTSGCRALAGAMPRRTAPIVKALAAAGSVIVGKTNLSEFSFEIRSRSSLGGDTRNPFAPDVTSGGSSGGTAVAVAAGFALAGIGTDTGGSIRVPAAYNGLVGLRPTWGVVSTAGVAPLAPSTDTVGAITTCVDDAALLFAILAPGRSLRFRSVAGMRVGVLRQLAGAVPDIARGMAAAADALRAAGVGVVDAPALPDAMIPAGAHIVDEEFGPAFDRYLRDNFQPGTAPASLTTLIDGGRFLPDYDGVLRNRARPRDPAVRSAILERHDRLREALDRMMTEQRFDALLYPPSVVLPVSMDNPKGGWAPELAACSGWPALVVPTGRAENGLPLSIELLGRSHAEPTLFALGRAIEAGTGPRPIPQLGQARPVA
ncbi:amidase [Sphingomonas sp. KR1UV-12]|uniref:Amidase n=1 Tax=Sphingomonas aurea TaxID=3063994 RepID=A0ABT9EJ37_9SPHN|nr:amidase [Sphingomonas sp. KR1UV-12]MDP1026964.1 amidase [Sphingomonas sp. KR1UV-12]